MIESSIASVLRDHATRYPKMQPQDAVKLLYQANFGPGHLIKDKEIAVARIEEEQKSASTSLSPTVEVIGHGYSRVYLDKSVSAQNLAKVFIESARAQTGNSDSFQHDISVLRALTADGCFAFDSDALDGYLTEYEAAGMPMVSHSKEYKNAYSPAYRVVLTSLAEEIITNE